jgi:hypothetical protein
MHPISEHKKTARSANIANIMMPPIPPGKKVTALARRGYENDPAIITAKILLR